MRVVECFGNVRHMLILNGLIRSDGFVETLDGKLFILPLRGICENGFPKVLINAISVGGSGVFKAQSIEPFIGMEVEFLTNNGVDGYNFKIKNKEQKK